MLCIFILQVSIGEFFILQRTAYAFYNFGYIITIHASIIIKNKGTLPRGSLLIKIYTLLLDLAIYVCFNVTTLRRILIVAVVYYGHGGSL